MATSWRAAAARSRPPCGPPPRCPPSPPSVDKMGSRRHSLPALALVCALFVPTGLAAAPPTPARPPIDALRDRLHFMFPGQKLDVQQLGLSLILTGQVKDAVTAQEIERVVVSYAAGYSSPGGGAPQVVNLLQVTGIAQVQLEVRFAEVSRTALRQIGVNLWTRTGTARGDVVGGVLGPNTGLNNALAPDLGNPDVNRQLQLPDGLPVLTSPVSGAVSLLFATSARSDVPLSATLSLLASRGFAKTLAEPTLVALSGQEATFLAGGEFPVPIPQALGVISVEFKKFGVQLRFTPFVLGDD